MVFEVPAVLVEKLIKEPNQRVLCLWSRTSQARGSGTVLDVGVHMTVLANVIVVPHRSKCRAEWQKGHSNAQCSLLSTLGLRPECCLGVCSTLCLCKAHLYFLNCVFILRATGKAYRTLFKASFFFFWLLSSPPVSSTLTYGVDLSHSFCVFIQHTCVHTFIHTWSKVAFVLISRTDAGELAPVILLSNSHHSGRTLNCSFRI